MFFHDDMRRREAAEPLLVVCDGAPGMIRAIDEMPAAHRASALPLSQGAQPQWRMEDDGTIFDQQLTPLMREPWRGVAALCIPQTSTGSLGNRCSREPSDKSVTGFAYCRRR